MTNEEREDLELDVWFALRKLEHRFVKLLSAIPRGQGAGAVDAEQSELWLDYLQARNQLEGPIQSLMAKLQRALPDPRAKPGDSLADRAWAAILIHYDERELGKTRHYKARPKVPLLQTEHRDLYDGGEQFFVYLEDALRVPGTPSLVLQLFLFCMRADFCGRYASRAEPERMKFENELCRRVAEDREQRQPPVMVVPPPPLPGLAFPYSVYVVALVFLFGFWLALEAMAEAHQAARSGLTCAAQ